MTKATSTAVTFCCSGQTTTGGESVSMKSSDVRMKCDENILLEQLQWTPSNATSAVRVSLTSENSVKNESPEANDFSEIIQRRLCQKVSLSQRTVRSIATQPLIR